MMPLPDDAPHILIVDDDERIRDLLSRYLQQNGYRVSEAKDGAAARLRLEGLAFDLVILDVMMPGETGFSLAGYLRSQFGIPMLMLTARSEPEHRIHGLEAGVDDYMSKPFEPRELLLRIQNIMKRQTGGKAIQDEVAFGPFIFNMRRSDLRRGDEAIRLTDKEREVLREFVVHHGRLLAREDLAKLGGYENERAVDVQINRLRQKIEADPANPVYLQTVRGKGYVLYID
jgi:two-component system phosphate regulon response regulator OmpR